MKWIKKVLGQRIEFSFGTWLIILFISEAIEQLGLVSIAERALVGLFHLIMSFGWLVPAIFLGWLASSSVLILFFIRKQRT